MPKAGAEACVACTAPLSCKLYSLCEGRSCTLGRGTPRTWQTKEMERGPGTLDHRPLIPLIPRPLLTVLQEVTGLLQPTLPTPAAPDAQGGNQWGEKGVGLKGLSPRKVASGRLSLTADNHSKVVSKGVNRVRPYRALSLLYLAPEQCSRIPTCNVVLLGLRECESHSRLAP